jgi:hypothetical protein
MIDLDASSWKISLSPFSLTAQIQMPMTAQIQMPMQKEVATGLKRPTLPRKHPQHPG